MNCRFLLVLLSFLLIGCSEKSNNKGVEPQDFIEDSYSFFHIPEHLIMCTNNKDSIFCNEFESKGNIQPTKEYAVQKAVDIYKKLIVNLSVEWKYNNTVYEVLEGDCEDIAMTIIQNHCF